MWVVLFARFSLNGINNSRCYCLCLLAIPRFTVPKYKLARPFHTLPVGNSVKLDCSATGNPRPTVRWYKDGDLFLQRQGSKRFYLSPWSIVLVLKDAVPSDTGKYTCNVSNTHGWINHSYIVEVHGKNRFQSISLTYFSWMYEFTSHRVTIIVWQADG